METKTTVLERPIHGSSLDSISRDRVNLSIEVAIWNLARHYKGTFYNYCCSVLDCVHASSLIFVC